MSELQLQKTATTARDGTPVRFVYDEEADILEIFFSENGPAIGIELTDHVVLRLDRRAQRALSLLLLHFSILLEQTEYGPRSFILDKVERLPEDVREVVLRVLTSLPVSQFLKVSQLQATPMKLMPVAYVESQPLLAYA
jgi:YD repeat-containing protein